MSIPPDLGHLVFEVPNFVSHAFCRDVISRAHSDGFAVATISTERGSDVVQDIRNNDRVIFDDRALANSLWHRAGCHFVSPFKGQRAVRLNERFRVYRYRPGHFFDWHQDGIFTHPDGSISQFTMMIYLNEACEGGGTSFADVLSPHVFWDFTIAPRTGKALFFHHPLSHRGDQITSGEKFVLRTDVMFESPR
ncbi:2OG-Fe(II) oxygenase [Yoonia sp. BS5-3]|uniref:2OG-Fe(II) oxygenase n=1 Tax=Yoonia phaeophyticola TaxID=3137369 RepID=A0ABZ2V1A6_9RHOB